MVENYKNSNEESENAESAERTRLAIARAAGQLTTKQKIMVFFFIVFIISFIFLWLSQFKSGIIASNPINKISSSGNNTSDSDQAAEDSEEALKTKDTDSDGIFDWDELYFYKTSPYLEDSDSDGLSDKKEIDAGENPNCPSGRDCASYAADGEPLSDAATTTASASSSAASFTAAEVAELRQRLIEIGVNQEILDAYSDEDLINDFAASYAEVVDNQ